MSSWKKIVKYSAYTWDLCKDTSSPRFHSRLHLVSFGFWLRFRSTDRRSYRLRLKPARSRHGSIWQHSPTWHVAWGSTRTWLPSLFRRHLCFLVPRAFGKKENTFLIICRWYLSFISRDQFCLKFVLIGRGATRSFIKTFIVKNLKFFG